MSCIFLPYFWLLLILIIIMGFLFHFPLRNLKGPDDPKITFYKTIWKGRSKFYLPALVLLGAEHAASKQEALSLEWKDIDFYYEGQGLIHFFRTKNTRERTEYLMPRTKEALLFWQEHQRWMRHRKNIDAGDSDLVFCRLN